MARPPNETNQREEDQTSSRTSQSSASQGVEADEEKIDGAEAVRQIDNLEHNAASTRGGTRNQQASQDPSRPNPTNSRDQEFDNL